MAEGIPLFQVGRQFFGFLSRKKPREPDWYQTVGRYQPDQVALRERARDVRESGIPRFRFGPGLIQNIINKPVPESGIGGAARVRPPARAQTPKEAQAARDKIARDNARFERDTLPKMQTPNVPAVRPVKTVEVPKAVKGERVTDALRKSIEQAALAGLITIGGSGGLIFGPPQVRTATGSPPPGTTGTGPPSGSLPPAQDSQDPRADIDPIVVTAKRRKLEIEPVTLPAGVSRRQMPLPPAPVITAPARVPPWVQLLIPAIVTGFLAKTPPSRVLPRQQVLAGNARGQSPLLFAQPFPVPLAQPVRQATATRDVTCEKRRRRNRKTCWKGLYRETSSNTRFTKWTKIDCKTGRERK